MPVGYSTGLGQAGDTIVEVLIALAMISMALGISYATANRSVQSARQAQEHSEALELVQAQIEQLRSAAKQHPEVFTASNFPAGFCVSGNNIAAPSCTTGLYTLTVTNLNDGYDTFGVVASWANIQGDGNDRVTMNYRLHQ